MTDSTTPLQMLAPMAGVTDLPFRLICREFGCEYAVTEMVSSKALFYGDKKTETLLQTCASDSPLAVQIFGSEPETMARAAKIARELTGAGIIDINMGCPVPKIVKNGEGSALMLKPELASDIISAVVSSAGVPVTVKIRKGFDSSSINAVPFAVMCEKAGAAAITVHGRTRVQQFTGTVDYSIIRSVREAVSIPVYANGDILSADDASKVLAQTGAAGIAIGRGAMGNPWIFREISALFSGIPIPARPDLAEIADTAYRHFMLALEFKSEKLVCLEMRKHFAWYLHGIKNAAVWRRMAVQIESEKEFRRIINDMKLNATGEFASGG